MFRVDELRGSKRLASSGLRQARLVGGKETRGKDREARERKRKV